MPTSNIELLLVEDSDADAELTLRALRRRHVTNSLHRAHDGVEALDFLFARGEYVGRDAANLPKVVVLTSSREDPDVARAYALGVNSYIVKPVSFDRFAESVRQVGTYWLSLNQPPLAS